MPAIQPTYAQLEQLLAACGGKGGQVDQLLEKEGGLNHSNLRRWLIARKGDIEVAAKDLKAHAEWRRDFMPTISLDTIAHELKQGKTFITGYDNHSHPVTIVVVSKHKPKDPEECKRFISYSLEASGQLGRLQGESWDGLAVGIFDLRGMTMSNYDVGAMRAVFDLLQNHYPERLAKMYLYCAPILFYGLWKLVSPFIDPVTKEKVVFVYEKEAAEIFARDFPKEALPRELGGCAQMTDPKQVHEFLQSGVEHPNVAAVKARTGAQQPAAGKSTAAIHMHAYAATGGAGMDAPALGGKPVLTPAGA